MNDKRDMSADEAIQRLKDGNQRFVRGASYFPRIQPEVLADLAKGQQPYATILGCKRFAGFAPEHAALRGPRPRRGCGAVCTAVGRCAARLIKV